MGRLAIGLVLGAALLAADPDPNYVLAQMKIEAIADDTLPPGTTVSLSPAEVNAYVRGEAAAATEEGLKDLDVRLGTGTVTATGSVNPSKLPGLQALGSSWLLGGLLQGEKPFRVRANVTSGGGTVTINIESLMLADQELDKGSRDFLLGWILRPFFGSAVLGEPIELENNVEWVRVRPSGIEIKIAD
jgi:hypothetical protein